MIHTPVHASWLNQVVIFSIVQRKVFRRGLLGAPRWPRPPTIGLAFLLFLAGLELDLTRLRGERLLAAALGMAGSVVVCLPVIAGLGRGSWS